MRQKAKTRFEARGQAPAEATGAGKSRPGALWEAAFRTVAKPLRAVGKRVKAWRRRSLLYHVDELSLVGDRLHIGGWLFDRKHDVEKLALLLRRGAAEERREITRRGLPRPDVAAAYQTGLHSGFDQSFPVKVLPSETLKAYLLCTVKGRSKRLRLGKIRSAGNGPAALLARGERARDQFLDGECRPAPLTESVTVIVPVYDGYPFLEKLFDGLRETDSRHRVILIDDNSPDARVLPALRRFASQRENTVVARNGQNLGFVKTANRGLRLAAGHAVLLNTDVELPRGWLERLMRPILQFENVASVTPFSNCATIFSFPEPGDNPLYRGLSADELDRCFQHVKPRYTVVPTAVGFCMAMSGKALKTVGLLDDEAFEKGYGEENDWCQRAIKAGFVNVHAENLFVYHKHGGSFLPEEKKRLMEAHSARLAQRHPNYPADVAAYVSRDPLKNLRAMLRFRVRCADTGANTVLVLTGDPDGYPHTRRPDGNVVLILGGAAETEGYRLSCLFPDETFRLALADWEDAVYLLRYCAVGEIVVNRLAARPDLFARLSDILELKREKDARLTMLIPGNSAVGPPPHLPSPGAWAYDRAENGDRLCARDDWAERCACPSAEAWRRRWEQFLLGCDEVRCLSEDWRQSMLRAYPTLPRLTVVPPAADDIPQKEGKTGR